MLEGKVALVTGAAAGIGRAAAIRMAAEGAKVAVVDVDVDGGGQTAQQIKDAGGDAFFLKTDVSVIAEVQNMVRRVASTYGRLDCAVNNAGVEGKVAILAESTEENFDHVIRVNLRGAFLCMKYEIVEMLKVGGGAIVNTASVAGLIGFGGISAYTASKHGIVGLTKNVALEYGKLGIRTNAVCPGAIDTRMIDRLAEEMGSDNAGEFLAPAHPIGRIGTPEEVAELMIWLCSDRASFMNGACIPIDGGYVAQ
jgi:NAD(P)-dependent dehydrogenase (short-subunit alcohol dehydrogenase family)